MMSSSNIGSKQTYIGHPNELIKKISHAQLFQECHVPIILESGQSECNLLKVGIKMEKTCKLEKVVPPK